MERDQNIQKISWFWDLKQRGHLDLDPPYQRRSVWTQEYRDYFIDTILLNYPAPAIFLFEETSPSGLAKYHVVDGKQRLTTVFDFIDGRFPVAEAAKRQNLRGRYFSDLLDDDKRAFFSYKFSVEYIPSADEGIINAIFDRINRNVAKLSPQELRHARHDGLFITAAEKLAESLTSELPADFPRIATSSKKHMKDVEFLAELLLYLEVGPRNHSQLELDDAFAQRDSAWEQQAEVQDEFRRIVGIIKKMVGSPSGADLARSRMRNQADFYALFAAVADVPAERATVDWAGKASAALLEFGRSVDDDAARAKRENAAIREYYDAARSNSNDIGQRKKRIEALGQVLGTLSLPAKITLPKPKAKKREPMATVPKKAGRKPPPGSRTKRRPSSLKPAPLSKSMGKR